MTQADVPRGHGKAKREIAFLQTTIHTRAKFAAGWALLRLGLRCGHLFGWQRWMRVEAESASAAGEVAQRAKAVGAALARVR